MNKKSILIITGFIVFAALSRLLPHAYNFTPIGAIALFGAAYFTNKKWAFIVPIMALWISDLLLNNIIYSAYYEGFAWFTGGFLYLYGSIAVTVLLGFLILKKITVGRVLGGAIGASLIFFIVSNFGVWLASPLYPPTLEGFIMCYTAAIPFFHYTLAGNVVYGAVLFGGYEWLKSAYPSLEPIRVNS
ncbi:MAG: DUF6580 family putative transport protein [Balneolaceae bacterium]